MNLSKRSFLTGVSAAAAALVIGPARAIGILAPIPTLWGDGIHDDIPAFKALFSGLPVKTVPGDYWLQTGTDFVNLTGGKYFLSESLAETPIATEIRRIFLSNMMFDVSQGNGFDIKWNIGEARLIE